YAISAKYVYNHVYVSRAAGVPAGRDGDDGCKPGRAIRRAMTRYATRRRAVNLTECACFDLRRATRAVSRMYDDFLRDAGLNITQFALRPNSSGNRLCLMFDVSIFSVPPYAYQARENCWQDGSATGPASRARKPHIDFRSELK